MRKFIIERDLPKIGNADRETLKQAAGKSNQALAQLAPRVQWVHSYVADDKTFCVYLAEDEAAIRRHAELSGFPATRITEVRRVIDPTTASG
ncbi:MAG: DUF4242 domain-containing protein [Rhodospirillales bacterium]|nr:DUF4242 domain-containing protein [Rhodospirillales bacterium]